jgi:radical SAM protein with 4Fe4S-binding SPASM domain
MVTTQVSNIGRRLLSSLRQDLSGFVTSISQGSSIGPGLYTYPIPLSGGKRRFHLRIEEGGQGILFVDVTDVVHLNTTAAEIAKNALDGLPKRVTMAQLAARYNNTGATDILVEVDHIYEMIDRFGDPGAVCPTCAVASLDRAPLFSLRAQAPYKADLALTYGCNNQCAHCYNEPDRFSMASLSGKDWRSVLDQLYDVGIPHIIFTGGEATLHPDLLELINYADSLGMVTGLNSNGRRMAKQSYAQLLVNSGLNHVQITLGSHQASRHDAIMGANSYHQTVAGIENALSVGLHCITNTTLMRCNMDHAEKIIDFIYDLGIRTFAMNGMIYSGGGFSDPNAIPESEMPPLLIRVRDHAAAKDMRFLWYTPTEYCRMSPVELEIGAKRCNAGEYSICIEPNGDVLPCQSFYTTAGNILRDSWSDIWQGDLFLSFRNREVDPRSAGLPEKCWDCLDLPFCGGGCRIEREARDGNRTALGVDNHLACGGGCGTNQSSLWVEGNIGFSPPPGATKHKLRSTGRGTALRPLRDLANGQNGFSEPENRPQMGRR